MTSGCILGLLGNATSSANANAVVHYYVLLRGSQWGGGFYGYRLKFWRFYGYQLIFSVTVNKKVKN